MLPQTIKVLIQALKKHRVEFVMFGMEALNLYARGPDEIFSTQDTDLLMGRLTSVTDILKSLQGVKKWPEPISVSYKTAGSAPTTVFDGVRWNIKKIAFEHEGTISVYTPTGLYHVDLVFGDCGVPFEELWKKSNRATYLGTVLRVARKEHILKSKQKAGRDKDLVILRRFKIGKKRKG